jgi:hypothetical protein
MSYGGSSNPDVTGWNNRKIGDARTAAALTTSTGAATGWTDVVTSSGSPGATDATPNAGGAAGGGATTGNNSGVYPDNVMIGYWFSQSGGVATHVFAGLDDAKAYDFTFFASRTSAGRSTQFTVNGAVQTLDASNNTTQTVTFAKVRPSGGAVNMSWTAGTLNGTTSTFGYINAGVITEYSIS